MSKKDLKLAFEQHSQTREDKTIYLSGNLGILLDGRKSVSVPGRTGFVFVRLLGNTSELIQAYSSDVSPIYDLPVQVTRIGNKWVVTGRDIKRYGNWGSSAYLPQHGLQHTFDLTQHGGGDVTWVRSEQFLPLNLFPSSTGTGLTLYPYTYLWEDEWKQAIATGTASFLPHRPPAASGTSTMVFVYLEGATGNLVQVPGTPFASSITGIVGLLPHIPTIETDVGIPLYAVRLEHDTPAVGWEELYDLRQFYSSGIGSLYLKLDQSTPQTIEGGAPTFEEGLDAGGSKITNLANGTTQTDAANIDNITNTLNAVLAYWLEADNSIRLIYAGSPAFYVQTPTQEAEEELTSIYFTSAVVNTPTPFTIKNGAEFIVHFNAKVTDIVGKKTAKVKAKLYYADSDGTSNLTQIGETTNLSLALSGSLVLQQLFGPCASEVTVPAGKRLVVKIFSVCTGASANYPEIQVEYGDVHDHLSIPVAGDILGNFVQKSFVLNTTSPLTIDGGASADLSTENRTLAIIPATAAVPGSMSAADFQSLRDGWIPVAWSTPTRTGNQTFTVAVDVTGIIEAGDKLRFTDTTTKYLPIYSVSFGSGVSTITCFTSTDFVFVGNPSAISYSKVENPLGWPTWFARTTTGLIYGSTGSAGTYAHVASSAAIFRVSGRTCEDVFRIAITNVGSWSGDFIATSACVQSANETAGIMNGAVYNGSTLAVRGRPFTTGSVNTIYFIISAGNVLQWSAVAVNDEVHLRDVYRF